MYTQTQADIHTLLFLLTVVWVVPNNVVSSTPVPQKKSGISGAGHDVAVSSDVGL